MQKNLHPSYARLLRNADFQKFLKALEIRRQKLFEAGESDDELRPLFERRGQRKFIKVLLEEGSCNALFLDTDK